MNLKAIYPGPRTTVPHSGDATYPYLLKEMMITRPHQVWQVDITYCAPRLELIAGVHMIGMH